MITNLKNDEQYVSIMVKDGTAVNTVITYLNEQQPELAAYITEADNEEILVVLPECGKGLDCSMKELKREIGNIATAEITMFRVDDEGERIRMI